MTFDTNILGRLRDAYNTRYEPEGIRTLANAFWLALLACALAILIGMFAYATLSFFDVMNELSIAASTAQPAPLPVDKAQFENLVRVFEERSAATTTPAASIADPSR